MANEKKGTIGGVISGAAAGAKVGAGLGIAAGPVGAISGLIPGLLIGGIIGGLTGNKIGNILDNKINKRPTKDKNEFENQNRPRKTIENPVPRKNTFQELKKYDNYSNLEIYSKIEEVFKEFDSEEVLKLINIVILKQITKDVITDKKILFDIYIKFLIIKSTLEVNENHDIPSDFLLNNIFNASSYKKLEDYFITDSYIDSAFNELKWFELKIVMNNLQIIDSSLELLGNLSLLEDRLKSKKLSSEDLDDMKVFDITSRLI